MRVPFLDLKAQYQTIKEEVDHALKRVLDSCAFAGGPFVEEFEGSFAGFCQCRYCAGVGSGTEALWLALLALGVGPGDEVVTTPNTFIATAEAITFCGATPAFVDVEELSCNMDPEKLKSFLEDQCKQESFGGAVVNQSTGRTVKAVVPVHLYGQTADMDPILEICAAFRLPVVEDASQAHGAAYKGRLAGSMGNVGCFSFYPGKNLGAYGEAGAVVTNDSNLADKVRILRDHGQSTKYRHQAIGWNCRMDGFQGAVLSVKLKHLDSWNRLRRQVAKQYDERLAGIEGLALPAERENSRHVYHIYAVRATNRQEFTKTLEKEEICSAIHYPVPIHLQEAYAFMGSAKGDFPVAEKLAEQEVSLPMFPEMTSDQIARVADACRRFRAK